VAEYLRRDNLAVFEKSYTDPETGQTTTILFSRSREVVESDLSQDDGKTAAEYPKAFSTENENPFAGFTPNLKQTGIFVDRFFHGASYADLSVKYEMSKDNARKTYHNAIRRLQEILKLMDEKSRGLAQYQKQIEERSGKLPKGQKWFLLNKLFGVMPHEIAEMEGMRSSSSVKQLIIRVSDQLRAGEIRLIETTPEEEEVAKLRLDDHREKRRGRHRNKKINQATV
jgi:DNA-directed RNA polymerase specialized sigma24 family protein